MINGSNQTLIRNINTSTLNAGDYVCAIQTSINGEIRLLDFAVFTVTEPPVQVVGDINIGSRGQLLVWLGDHHKYHDIKDQKQLDAHYQTDTYIDLNAQRVYLAYLIKVVPELKVNDVLKLTGSEMNLGSELVFKTNIIHPGRSSQINYVYKIPAGSYVSVNTVAGSVSPDKLIRLQTRLNQTKTILESNDPALIQNLTREEMLGDMFYTGTLGYFSQLLVLNQVGALQAKAQYHLSAVYGTFGYEPKVDYLFGLPAGIRTGGVALDIPMKIVT